jgi:putative membrane protein
MIDDLIRDLEWSLVFSLLGIVLFAIAFWLIIKVTPFSIRKEIEEDQNIALAIIIASTIFGIALIIAAAIHGG